MGTCYIQKYVIEFGRDLDLAREPDGIGWYIVEW
jgi:hypothetical protein